MLTMLCLAGSPRGVENPGLEAATTASSQANGKPLPCPFFVHQRKVVLTSISTYALLLLRAREQEQGHAAGPGTGASQVIGVKRRRGVEDSGPETATLTSCQAHLVWCVRHGLGDVYLHMGQ